MRNLLNPKWLFIINTLPIVVLFFLFFEQFSIIKTLLNEESIQLWKNFGLTLGILGLLNFGYAAYLTVNKQNVSVLYGIIALFCYISFIYVFGFYVDKIIPFSIPQWMISGNLFIYVATFLMPTLAYSLFALVAHFTTEAKEHKAWLNFAIAIAIPVLGYVLSQIGSSLWRIFYGTFGNHAMILLVITATLVFLFFLIRGIFILATKKAEVWKKYQLLWKIPVTIILPLIGLLVNNGRLADNFSVGNSGVFGDFNSYWFYILALVNGILLCLPNLENKIYRLFLFAGRSVTFAFTLYLFLVFLPFLPLSVIAIIAIGTGFLMLTPLLLFVIHIHELSKDFSFLKSYFSKKISIGIFSLGFLVIPVCLTANYLNDRRVLNKTLEYLYTPDYSKQYTIDKNSLQKTLNVIRNHKDNNRGGIFGGQQPYLSTYFNWLVLDNLTLSDTKINYIERVFFGETSFELWNNDNIRNENVKITNISTSSVYDKEQKVWKSWVDLEITNNRKDSWFAEYATTIDLPEGCWISDYYLYVGDKKEYGMLAEKRSAMWVFSNIRNENRDPGILYYLTGNKVAFRVFPFAEKEVRKTGIEFLHKEPITLRIDGNTVALGNEKETIYENVETENVAFVSSKHKQKMKWTFRKPTFHFLVDVSRGKDTLTADFTKRIEQIVEEHKWEAEDAKISFVNSYVNTFPLNNDWKRNYQSQTFEGGFFLERAIQTALFNAYKNKIYSVIVVVTDSIQNAVLDKDFSDFDFAFPESILFFNLDNNGNLRTHYLTDKPKKEKNSFVKIVNFADLIAYNYSPDTLIYSFEQPVLEYKLSDSTVVYLDGGFPIAHSIILKKDIFEIDKTEIQEKNWQSGLTMQAQWRSQILHPEISGREWLNLVKNSFISKIMMPVTSYLVVENEAQKAALKKKQEQVLSSNKSLDLDENSQRMSEPSLWILAGLFGLALLYKRKRKKLNS
ncbi:MAG: MSEP-CTERM sorting domain-containing protein [Bacteroidetes bacterium]|nr:MSEP-CTERM sorting domain-containing protein [Bacteroidota bacterium]